MFATTYVRKQRYTNSRKKKAGVEQDTPSKASILSSDVAWMVPYLHRPNAESEKILDSVKTRPYDYIAGLPLGSKP